MFKKTLAVLATSLFISTNASASLVGPTWAPTYSWVGSGISPSHSGGVNWNFTGFDAGEWSALYMGINDAGLALDGSIDDDGANVENLTFSSIIGNQAYAYGNSNIIGNANYDTRFRFTLTDLDSNAVNFEATDLGTGANLLGDVTDAVLDTGGFNLQMEAQILSGGSWQAARIVFDPNSGLGQGGDLQTSIYSGLYYASPVPVPAAAWLFGSGLLGLLGVARRKSA